MGMYLWIHASGLMNQALTIVQISSEMCMQLVVMHVCGKRLSLGDKDSQYSLP